MDGDPVYDGTNLMKWYEHAAQYRVPSSPYLMTYWAPSIGAENQGEEETALAVLRRFNSIFRNLLARTPNQVFVDQWLFQDNTPRFRRNARVRPSELSRFIRDSAQSLLQSWLGVLFRCGRSNYFRRPVRPDCTRPVNIPEDSEGEKSLHRIWWIPSFAVYRARRGTDSIRHRTIFARNRHSDSCGWPGHLLDVPGAI